VVFFAIYSATSMLCTGVACPAYEKGNSFSTSNNTLCRCVLLHLAILGVTFMLKFLTHELTSDVS